MWMLYRGDEGAIYACSGLLDEVLRGVTDVVVCNSVGVESERGGERKGALVGCCLVLVSTLVIVFVIESIFFNKKKNKIYL